MKKLLNVALIVALFASCTYDYVTPQDSDGQNLAGTYFIFGRTAGPNTFAPTPYNIFKISGGKLFGTFVPSINPDSLELYPMTALSPDKYQTAADLPSQLPKEVFPETKTLIGLINIDSGYDFVKVSREAGSGKFFYVGDAGIPDYMSAFKQALDKDLVRLSQ